MLTDGQRRVLEGLASKPLISSDLVEHLNSSSIVHFTYDRVHSILRRLEDRMLVRRVYAEQSNVALWELTVAGRKALES